MGENSKMDTDSLKTPNDRLRKNALRNQSSNIKKSLEEALAFACCYLQVRLKEGLYPYQALTTIGRFNHYIVGPFFSWHGENDRILITPSIGQVRMQRENGITEKVVNGGSHNYAGFYKLSPEDENLHRKCLDNLPIADARTIPLLNTLMLRDLAKFFNADCCYSTTTGYQANMLGIPAIAGKDWLIVVDERSHNSIFTAAYAANAKKLKRFKHNDMVQLYSILEATQGQYSNTLVVVEGLYSMDGTIPPLDLLYQLKQKFHITLYADEAHSFGSIGSTGRGCLELWNELHPNNPVPADMIDIRSAVLSKAVGGLGGFVCASARFNDNLFRRADELQNRGESPTTSTILQTLAFLHQPIRLRKFLHRLRDISRFCHEELERQGIRVYGNTYAPMLPVYGGRPSKSAELSHVLRKLGLVASPVSTPAVEVWESRVRVTLSASYSDEDVNQMVSAIVEASQRIGLSKPTRIPRHTYCYTELMEDRLEAVEESHKVYCYLNGLLEQQTQQLCPKKVLGVAMSPIKLEQSIVDVGHAARQKYGLGSGSARWILGTFPPHLEVEALTATLTKQPSALTYPDSDLGLMSTIAGLCRPIIGCIKHYFLLPSLLSSTAEEGLRVASKNSGTTCIRYASHDDLVSLFGALSRYKDTYITIYLDMAVGGGCIDMTQVATRLAANMGAAQGATLLLNENECVDCYGDQLLGIEKNTGLNKALQMLSARLLVSGSFYRAFGLPGGYLAGNTEIVEELRYTSRCYMFTTSPQPFIMAMIKEALQLRLRTTIGSGTKIVDKTYLTFQISRNWMRLLNKSKQSPVGFWSHILVLIACLVLFFLASVVSWAIH